jgi:hypothetical protein
VLIIGSYDSQIVNWEPMFPYTFVSGDTPWVTLMFSTSTACISCHDRLLIYFLFSIM